jgi:hypothetical protein
MISGNQLSVVYLGGFMIRSLALLLALFSATSFTKNHPNAQFPGGNYLGEGKYMISNGATGTYASFADLDGDEWKLSYVRNGKPLLYSVYLEFGQLGFFDASISETDSNGEGVTHYGQGYCGSKQCHLSFDLGERYIEETITLSPATNQIYRLGSLSYTDENGDEQTVAWEELMFRIDSDEDEKKGR